MGSIGGLIGTAGGAAGTGFSGPAAANITNPVTSQQISDAYTASQGGLQSQQALLGALQGQQGLQNQSSVYNQLQNVASGQGPNPARAQLAQATGQNIAAQGALQAGQRGANANVGLMARNIAQQGAATQQQAVGQGSTMQAQQSLAALQGLGSLATTQAQQQIGQTNALSQAQQAEQAQLLNAQAAYNSAQVGSQQSVNAANAGLAGTQMQGQQGLIGGAMQGGAALLAAKGGMIKAANGFPDPGDSSQSSDSNQNNQASSMFGKFIKNAVNPSPQQDTQSTGSYGNPGANQLSKGSSAMTQALLKNKPSSSDSAEAGSINNSADAGYTNMSTDMSAAPFQAAPIGATSFMKEGGPVPAMVSPGEKYLNPSDVEQVKQGANPMEVGETIPGKPKVKGAKNSYANDTVPKTLTEGGIVIPRSVTQGPNAHWASMKFVYQTLKKGQKKNGR